MHPNTLKIKFIKLIKFRMKKIINSFSNWHIYFNKFDFIVDFDLLF